MLAVVAHRYGDPEVLELAEVPTPEPGAGEVLVQVRASGTNPVDAECRQGQAAPWFDEGPYIWGWDISGIVVAVGPGATGFAPGDAVYGMPRFPVQARGYAEYVTAPAEDLAAKPAHVSHTAAAALPLCGLTALQVLDLAGASAGQRVLVNGASGGVGHLAVQLARARGCHVIGVAREVNHDFVRGLGADEVIDYTVTGVADAVRDVDVVVDLAGVDSLLETVRFGGVIAPVPGAARGAGPLEEAAARRGVRVLRHVVHPDRPALGRLAELVERGALAAEITRELPLEEAVLAHKLLEAGHARGKVVLTPPTR
ncbi:MULTISPECIES: NADP-dependent oxidoreductase [unclassified Streptomyces]|uniref:NADP-dependent oxidoreductase n=1 Tax=unclassified Streptomyces TaxID=2593676 RepID=UPI0037F40F33